MQVEAPGCFCDYLYVYLSALSSSRAPKPLPVLCMRCLLVQCADLGGPWRGSSGPSNVSPRDSLAHMNLTTLFYRPPSFPLVGKLGSQMTWTCQHGPSTWNPSLSQPSRSTSACTSSKATFRPNSAQSLCLIAPQRACVFEAFRGVYCHGQWPSLSAAWRCPPKLAATDILYQHDRSEP